MPPLSEMAAGNVANASASAQVAAFDAKVAEAIVDLREHALAFTANCTQRMGKWLRETSVDDLQAEIIPFVPAAVKEFFGGGRQMTTQSWLEFAMLGELGGDETSLCHPDHDGNIVYIGIGVPVRGNGRVSKYAGKTNCGSRRSAQHRRMAEPNKLWYGLMRDGDVKQKPYFTAVWRRVETVCDMLFPFLLILLMQRGSDSIFFPDYSQVAVLHRGTVYIHAGYSQPQPPCHAQSSYDLVHSGRRTRSGRWR